MSLTLFYHTGFKTHDVISTKHQSWLITEKKSVPGAGFTFDWQVSSIVASLLHWLVVVVAERKWRRGEGVQRRRRGDLLLSGMEERGVSVLRFNFLNMFSPAAATIPGDPRTPSFLDLQMCLRWEDALLAFVYQQPQLESQWKYLCIISDPRSHQGQSFLLRRTPLTRFWHILACSSLGCYNVFKWVVVCLDMYNKD